MSLVLAPKREPQGDSSVHINETTPNNSVLRFTVWQHGQPGRRQTNKQLCTLLGEFCKQCELLSSCPTRPMSLSVKPVRTSRGPAPQPIQVDISCYIPNMYSPNTSDEEEEEGAEELVEGFLWPNVQKFMKHPGTQNIYAGYLIGYSLEQLIPVRDGNRSVSQCSLEPFELPEQVEHFCKTKFYDGPTLAFAAISEMLKGYEKAILDIAGVWPSLTPHEAIVINGIQKTVHVLPILRSRLMPVLKTLDRSSVPTLVQMAYEPVLRCLEDTLVAVQNLATNTVASEPSGRDVVAAIYALYTLKSAAPALTSAVNALKDVKKQNTIKWATITATGAVAVCTGVALLALPIAAPATIIAIELGGSGLEYLASAIELGKTEQIIVINKDMNEKIEYMVYYLALCFMKSSGMKNPRDDLGAVNQAVESLAGKKPSHKLQAYSAKYLQKLVRAVSSDFDRDRQSLSRMLKAPLEALDFHPLPEIEDSEVTFTF